MLDLDKGASDEVERLNRIRRQFKYYFKKRDLLVH